MNNLVVKRILPEMKLAEKIKQIESESFGEGAVDEWVIMPLMRYGRIYGAFIGEVLVGIIEMIISESYQGYIFSFAIRSAVRNLGYGEELLRKVIDDVREAGVLKELILTSAEDNSCANKIYEKLGFKKGEKLLNEYGRGIDRISWSKKL